MVPTFRSWGYVGGNQAKSSNFITNVCYNEQDVYDNERYSSPLDTFRFLFRCPPGVYQVTLHEAETFMSGPNQRRFDVFLQGEKKFANIDIFAAAGGANKAVTFSSQTNNATGMVEVQFKPVYDNARISGIHVRKIAELISDSDGIPDWWRLGVFGHATGLAADQSRGSDDPDGDGRTNYQEYVAGTDPTSAGSVFQITAIRRQGNDIYVSYLIPNGRTYDLQYTSSLSTPNWISLGTQAGNGLAVTTIDYGGASRNPQQFYRLVALP